MRLTRQILHSAGTSRSGFNRLQLEKLGVQWPPKKGWLSSLIGKEVPDETWEEVLSLKGPASTRRENYERYLESSHWKNLRAQAFKRDGGCCVKCGSRRNLRGHHKQYGKDLHAVPVDWIVTLCDLCHEAEHRRLAKERKAARGPRQPKHHHLTRLFL